jgi:hypothetical protein
VVATEVVATEAEDTLGEGSTEAGCQPQVVPAVVKRFSAGRRLRVAPAWPATTVVRSLHRLAAVPRQIAAEVQQI